MRELDFFKETSQLEPMKINDFIYYRRVDNLADNMTIYRFPVDELQKYGIPEGELPFLREPIDPDDEE